MSGNDIVLEQTIQRCKSLSANPKTDEEIEALRAAQNSWKSKDYEGLKKYYGDLLNNNQESAVYHYLYGRILNNRLKALFHARYAIKLDPNWVYSYRLLMGTYCQCLFHVRCSRKNRIKLAKEIEFDSHYFERSYEEFNENPGIFNYVFDYYIFQKRFNEAEALLKKAQKRNFGWALGEDCTLIIRAGEGNDKYLQKRIMNLIKQAEHEGNLDTADRESVLVDWKVRYYRAAFAFEAALETLRQWTTNAPKEDLGGIYFDISRFEALLNRDDNAFAALDMAVQYNFNRTDRLIREKDLLDLHCDSRWPKYEIAFKENWRKERDIRRKEALKHKTKLIVPDCSLRTIDGEIFGKSHLQGKVTILDFWATICSPCKKVLPVLDRFMNDDMDERIEIYTVNVWDNDRRLVKSFLDRNGYKMKLLFCDSDNKRKLAINSIPTLYVIGPDGIIYYCETGYRIGLKERLEVWTEDLLKMLDDTTFTDRQIN